MAKRIIHLLVDDLDGGEATETVLFALDGVTYEIDLSQENAEGLRAALVKYVNAGVKVARTRGQASIRPHVARTGKRNRNGMIRSWFNKLNASQRAALHPQGKTELGDKGRIPQAIVDEYDATVGVNRPISAPSEAKPEPAKAPEATFQPAEVPAEQPNGSKPLERMTRDELRQYARDHGMSSVTRLTSVPSLLAAIRKVEVGEAPVVEAAHAEATARKRAAVQLPVDEVAATMASPRKGTTTSNRTRATKATS